MSCVKCPRPVDDGDEVKRIILFENPNGHYIIFLHFIFMEIIVITDFLIQRKDTMWFGTSFVPHGERDGQLNLTLL